MRRWWLVVVGVSLPAGSSPAPLEAQSPFGYGVAEASVSFDLSEDQRIGWFHRGTRVTRRSGGTAWVLGLPPAGEDPTLRLFAEVGDDPGFPRAAWALASAQVDIFNYALGEVVVPLDWEATAEAYAEGGPFAAGAAFFSLRVRSVGRVGGVRAGARTRYGTDDDVDADAGDHPLFLPPGFVNQRGEVVPSRTRVQMHARAYATAQVLPEPGTMILLASGLLGAGGAGALRRRRGGRSPSTG